MDELQVKTMPALDWHGIWPGYVSHDEEGLYFPQDLPTGIRLAVQQAECSDPVMVRQKRWEAGNIHYPSLSKGRRPLPPVVLLLRRPRRFLGAGRPRAGQSARTVVLRRERRRLSLGAARSWGGSNTRVPRITISSLSATKWVRPMGT